ncbi:hypothetical protein [Enterobacter bugandensis]|uniref:hypothetical protein n=1 Tax=Enterobacter bugandensis TaxID=881260 RepID=UPI002D764F10|nr:hypothetical protein [Enterobacter bugandensis]WRT52088.1 hypothetical protein VK758_03030 [Enterobacter bugandensis]
MKRLPLTVVMMGVISLAGCHDRREGVKSLLGDGVEQWGQKLPYDHWQFNFFYPVNLLALVSLYIWQSNWLRAFVELCIHRPAKARRL